MKFYRVAYATATAANASVSLNPGAGRRVAIDRIFSSYSLSSQSGVLTVNEGGTDLFSYDVHGSDGLVLEKVFNAGAAVTVTLSAGGVGVAGRVTVLYEVY